MIINNHDLAMGYACGRLDAAGGDYDVALAKRFGLAFTARVTACGTDLTMMLGVSMSDAWQEFLSDERP